MSEGRRIQLSKAEFFELLAKHRAIEVLRLEAKEKAVRLVAQMIQREIATAVQDGQQLFAAMGQTHGFDPTLSYGFDEQTCELIAPAPMGLMPIGSAAPVSTR